MISNNKKEKRKQAGKGHGKTTTSAEDEDVDDTRYCCSGLFEFAIKTQCGMISKGNEVDRAEQV